MNYRLGSPVTSVVTRRQSRIYFVRGFSSLVTGYKKVPFFLQNRGHAEVLKKTPSFAEYVTWCSPPESPPPPPPPPPPTLDWKRAKFKTRLFSHLHLRYNSWNMESIISYIRSKPYIFGDRHVANTLNDNWEW